MREHPLTHPGSGGSTQAGSWLRAHGLLASVLSPVDGVCFSPGPSSIKCCGDTGCWPDQWPLETKKLGRRWELVKPRLLLPLGLAPECPDGSTTLKGKTLPQPAHGDAAQECGQATRRVSKISVTWAARSASLSPALLPCGRSIKQPWPRGSQRTPSRSGHPRQQLLLPQKRQGR